MAVAIEKAAIGAGRIIPSRVIGREHLPSSAEGIESLSAAVTIEPVIESHLFLLLDEVKRPRKTPWPDPKSDQLFS